LKRAIQQELENPLARRILAGEFGPGDTVMVDVGREGLTFRKSSPINSSMAESGYT
jgi:ATP-dependent Clp protease ATP-binding subunit ClpB